ncbi:MAG: sugar transporter [Pseudomonadota bacterium]
MNKPSWFFWTVAVLALLWNAFGVFDFWMTSTGDEQYLADYDPQIIEWIIGFPIWRKAIWAASVASGVFGALALLARRRVAVPLLLLYFALMVFGFAGHDILLADGVKMYGALGLIMSAALIAVAGMQWLYADRAAKKGYLA